MDQSISILVSGKVQGVFYRQSTKTKAIELGITGEVKNNSDGTVSIIASGTVQALEEFIAWCKKGPERAVVTGIKVEEISLQSFAGFRVVR